MGSVFDRSAMLVTLVAVNLMNLLVKITQRIIDTNMSAFFENPECMLLHILPRNLASLSDNTLLLCTLGIDQFLFTTWADDHTVLLWRSSKSFVRGRWFDVSWPRWRSLRFKGISSIVHPGRHHLFMTWVVVKVMKVESVAEVGHMFGEPANIIESEL